MLFKELNEISTSPEDIDSFLKENSQSLYDLYNGDYEYLITQKEDINNFILTKRLRGYELLDYSKSYNKAFIIILLDFCSRLDLSYSTVQIENVINANKLFIGARLDAAKTFLLAPNNKELIDSFDDICYKLQIALIEEEDSEQKVLVTFANYFGKIVKDTSIKFVDKFYSKAADLKVKEQYYFIQHRFVDELLRDKVYDQEEHYLHIQNLIEDYLGKATIRIFSKSTFVIERSTLYANLLAEQAISFNKIWQIAFIKVSELTFEEREDLHRKILRGVKVLEEENELYGYLLFYGKMHNEKLKTALHYIPEHLFNNELQIIDWGCGQGIGTITLFDYLISKQKPIPYSSITLIEPSDLALRRASLHIKKYNNDLNVTTIKSDFDNLIGSELNFKTEDIKIHLFSNILDVELFSLSHLIERIEKSCSGINYFICVSPFINDIKTARIDSFVSYFSENSDFELLSSIDNRKGEWINNWTRVVRVFKSIL